MSPNKFQVCVRVCYVSRGAFARAASTSSWQSRLCTRQVACLGGQTSFPDAAQRRRVIRPFWQHPLGTSFNSTLCMCKSMFVDPERRTLAVARSFKYQSTAGANPEMHSPYRQHWRPIQDGSDTILPLTWERVRSSHEWLAAHAACPGAPGIPPAPPPQARPAGGGYTSEDDFEPCFCTQDVAVWTHFRNVCKESCVRWPGPICGSCWAASCECGYVFDDEADAAGRWFTGRMRCHECTASGPGWDGWHGLHTAW